MATIVQVPKRVIIKFSGKVMRSHSGTDSCVTNDSEQDISMKRPASGGSNNCNAESMLDSQKLSKRKMGPGMDFCGTEDYEPDIKAKATTSGGCNKRNSETVLDAQRLMRRKMDHGRDPKLDTVKVVSVAGASKKRKPAYMIESQRPKRRKMDRGVKLKCGHILRELSMHRFGWVFSKPVDPVALRIPDYFDIISDPMDLGTIKSKLENNEYSCAEEFASDVNLTFSNAMRYNPPGDGVNQMAKDLDSMFRSMWKPAVRKWNLESSGVDQGISEDESEKYGNDKNYSEKPSSNAAIEVKKSVTLEEKERLWKEYMSMVDGKIPEKLCNTLKSSKSICLMEGKTGNFKFDKNDVDDSTWLELGRWLKRIKAAKVVTEKTDNTGSCSLSAEVAHRGASGSIDGKPSMSSSSSKCSSCGGMRCHCGDQHKSTFGSPNDKSFRGQRPAPRVDAVKKDLSMNSTTSNQGVRKKDLPTHATSSDSVVVKKDLPSHATSLDSNAARKDLQTSLGSNGVRKEPPTHARISGANAVKKDVLKHASSNSNVARNTLSTHETSSKSNVAKIDLPVCATTSGQDSHGFGSVKDEEKTSTSTAFSPPLSTATPGEGYTWQDDQSSLEKAQRAAMLKSRFAETILKANGNSDPKRLQEEKERLERLQREEEARIKAILEEQQLHLQKRIEKARQDALSALEMMERTAMVHDNLESLKELENLCGCPPSHCLYGSCFRRRLQLIGLFLKEDDFLEDEDEEGDSVLCENDDREEGEI